MKKLLAAIFILAGLGASAQQKNSAQLFFDKLKTYCGNAYEGEVTAGARNDEFTNNKLIMHVRSCSDNTIRIPFFVGDDRSRTWVLTLANDRILLKHDHRLEDGSEDEVTQYGGWTVSTGSDTLQLFPADQYTCDLIPYAANNVWYITISDDTFTYNLLRIGSNRLFSVTFNLRKKVAIPPAPWGWVD